MSGVRKRTFVGERELDFPVLLAFDGVLFALMVGVRVGLAVALVTGSLGLANQARASEGVPDPSFGNGGVATYELGLEGRGRSSQFGALGVSPGGNIYVAGESRNERNFAALIASVTDSGALDSSFGKSGVLLGERGATPVEQITFGNAVSVEPNGVTVAGSVSTWIEFDHKSRTTGGFVERLTSSGTLDPRFKTHALSFPAGLLQRLPGGRLLVAGRPTETPSGAEPGPRIPALLEMLSPGGAPVTSFGRHGIAELFNYSGTRSAMSVRSVVPQKNGDLIVSGVGSYRVPGPRVPDEQGYVFLWLARLTPSGALDQSFGKNGMSIPWSAPSTQEVGGPGLLEPRPGGFALVGTTENQETRAQITVWGLTDTGATDPSYGSHGVTIVPDLPAAVRESPTAATVDNAGRLLIAATNGDRSNPELVRITPSGQIDRSFGHEGTGEGPPQSYFSALAVEPSGRILAAGSLEPESGDPSDGAWLEEHGLQDIGSLIERFLATNTESTNAAPVARITLVSPRIGATQRGITIKLACAGAANCLGTLTITTTGTGKRSRRKETVIGRSSFSIAASRTATVALAFNAAGRALLQTHRGRLDARLTITKSQPSPREKQVDQVRIVRTRSGARRAKTLKTTH